ncbi:peptide deformylase [Curvivirga aplysinae]|uniref:peptide deformylase n=1 Tax=Curvivirga aplysinae TaxID=2529852 RepID=UPI0012BB59DC|nr:peptide deformylase [Curvivirga aplysinae]MTI10624.1 peptide deformylase [Curvivirga aplysinae]
MAILDILVAPHPVLKKVAAPIDEVNDEIRQLMDDMMETMYDAPGIGLAAPQVGVSKRVLVMDIGDEETGPQPIKMANPEIAWASDDMSSYNEGCLSFPEQYANVDRPSQVKIKYLDENNVAQELDADGLLATCVQHEIDHLDGVVFVDRLSSLKRNMILRKLKKWVKSNAA